jgi:putative SOS response-associated peptidase YedK
MRDGKVELMPTRWGLVPWWWKKPMKELPSTFNARAETVATKPMFRDAFKRSRCAIPASGYYEWQPMPTGKQPTSPRRTALCCRSPGFGTNGKTSRPASTQRPAPSS